MRNSWGTLCGCTWASWERSLEKTTTLNNDKTFCGLKFDQMGTSKMNISFYGNELIEICWWNSQEEKKTHFFLSFCYTYNVQHRLLFDLLIWNNLFYSIGTHKCTVEDIFLISREEAPFFLSCRQKKSETRPINSEWKQQVSDVKFWWGNARWTLALSIQINLRYTNITKKQQEYDRIKRYKWNNKRIKHANQTDQ